MKKEVKVKVIFTEGYEERFTKACIKVAKKRADTESKIIRQEKIEKIAKAV